MTELLHLDEQLFRFINIIGQNAFFDWIMPFWRNKLNWIPLYLLLAFLTVYKLKMKGVYILVVLFLTLGISDTISSKVIKKTVKRERPCRAAELSKEANVLVFCGGGYSFTSSHATNHFAVAVFLILTLGSVLKRWRYLLLPWAFLVAYAQVYVGVHYPLDVICGAILGSLIAYLVVHFYKNIKKLR